MLVGLRLEDGADPPGMRIRAISFTSTVNRDMLSSS